MRIKGLVSLVATLSLLLTAGIALADGPTFSWLNRHDGGTGGDESGTMLLACPDGNLIAGGESRQSNGAADLFVRRINKDTGITIWEFNYSGFDGTNVKDVSVTGLVWDNSGQLLVAGYIHGCIG